MKKIILISVVTLAWTIISLYGYSNLNNKIDTVSRQMYKIKEYQDGVKLYLNVLSENYDTVSNYIDYKENNLNEEITNINNKIIEINKNLINLDNLILSKDDFIIEEIENLKENVIGVNAGLGVLTGRHITGVPEEELIPVDVAEIDAEVVETVEPVVYTCPKLNRSVNFGDYISDISFSRDVSTVISYDIELGSINNVQVIEGRAGSKLLRAITRYLTDAVDTDDITITACQVPFKINV
tara:strand:- start:964 stop:1683 length:720 start_codon:yes stop_codon:yes gene_type:complete